MSLTDMPNLLWEHWQNVETGDGWDQFGPRLARVRSGPRQILCVHLRELIYRRDCGTCCNCRGAWGPPFEIDHIHPWSAGGEDASYNLQLLCIQCNQAKSNRRHEMPFRPPIVTACPYCNRAVEHGDTRAWCSRCDGFASVSSRFTRQMDRWLVGHCDLAAWTKEAGWEPGKRPAGGLINEWLKWISHDNDAKILELPAMGKGSAEHVMAVQRDRAERDAKRVRAEEYRARVTARLTAFGRTHD